jgi:hypothetical protein
VCCTNSRGLIRVPGASHLVVIEQAQLVAQVIEDFLTSPEPPETMAPVRPASTLFRGAIDSRAASGVACDMLLTRPERDATVSLNPFNLSGFRSADADEARGAE